MSKALLTTQELATRWSLSPDTLRKWRSRGVGPDHFKAEGQVFYLLSTVKRYEKKYTRYHHTPLRPKVWGLAQAPRS